MIEFRLKKLLQSPEGEMNLDVDLKLKEGSLMTIYGKSGAGKSTLLMLLAGLIAPDRGKVSYGDKIWLDTDKKISLSPQKREIGFG